MPAWPIARRLLRLAPWCLLAWLSMVPRAHARSPVWGDPYRRGFAAEFSVGPNFCLAPGMGGGRCDPRYASRTAAGFALHAVGGYRLHRNLLLGAGFDSHNLGSGTTASGRPLFVEMSRIGVLGVVRVVLPVSRGELGIETGVGWSRQSFVPNTTEIGPFAADGLALRPALVYDHWLLADFFIGVEVSALLHLHSRFCADAGCASDLGVVPVWYRDTLSHDLSVALRAGVVFSWTP